MEETTSPPKPYSDTNERGFFVISHSGCALFLALLAIVAALSVGQFAFGQLRPTEEFEGLLGTVEADGTGLRTTYGVTLERDNNTLLFLRLRNSGRILRTLQENPFEGPVLVEARSGQIVAIQALEEPGYVVQEQQASSWLFPALALLSIFVMALLVLPWAPALRAQRHRLTNLKAPRQAALLTDVEEEA